jgi:MYXO-CTERM domain-containing protein
MATLMTLPSLRVLVLRRRPLALLGSVALASLMQTSLARAATYYVAPAPAGSDTNNTGSEASPFASMARAQTAAAPGDTVFFKAGTYVYTQGTTACASQTAVISGVVLSKSGTADLPINYFAAPGERPILDFDGIRDSCRIKGILLSGSFIHLRGLELRGVRQNNNLNHESWGVWIQGSNNVLETLDIHNIMGAGVFIQRGSNNLVLNVDSHDNLDELTSNGAGESADGFGCHVSAGETGNVFRGCRAWWNADDGYDFINAFAACTVERSWAWYNGYRPGTLTAIGNGNGFKAGGYGADPATFPNNPPQHVVRQNLSVLNRAAGFYANHHPVAELFTNNTGYGNRPNFNMLGMDPNGGDITVGVYRNNLAVGGTLFSNRNGANDANNSWTIAGINVSDGDFQGVSQIGLDAPRQADGSLPLLANFRLAADSDVIDRGVDVQLPFAGAAPDLGAFESGLVLAPPDTDPLAPEAPPSAPGPATDSTPTSPPTFAVAGPQGDAVSTGAPVSGMPVATASDPSGAADPSGSLDGAGTISGSSSDPSASGGCACRAAGGGSPGASPSLALVVLALVGLRRRSARGAS